MGAEQLFEQFAEEYRRGGAADPRPFLTQVSGAERAELQILIEAFLERAPRRRWDPAAFSGSPAERAVERAGADAGAAPAETAEGWPVVLPALRTKARLKRRTVVERLAQSLGFPDQQDRVAAYYHQMEQGQLPSAGVSIRVLEALAAIIGASAEYLRRSGEAGESGPSAGGEVFARVGATNEESRHSPGSPTASVDFEEVGTPDELDSLFTAGDQDVR